MVATFFLMLTQERYTRIVFSRTDKPGASSTILNQKVATRTRVATFSSIGNVLCQSNVFE